MRILGLVGLLGIAGCAGAPRPSAPPERPAAAESTPTLPPARAVSLQLPTAGDEDYRLAAKDQISVTVFGQKDVTRTLRVSQSGTITMPLLGEVKAGGLSPAELERKIEDGLRGRYLINPRVTVAVAEYQGRQVAVVGAVNQPGAYLLKANHTTVLNALSEAKGVKDGADRIAYVVHARPRPGEPQPVMVYLDMLLRQAHPAYNVVVEPGDSIFVPPANTYDVAGEVEKRGAFVLRRETTLARAHRGGRSDQACRHGRDQGDPDGAVGGDAGARDVRPRRRQGGGPAPGHSAPGAGRRRGARERRQARRLRAPRRAEEHPPLLVARALSPSGGSAAATEGGASGGSSETPPK